MGGGLMQLVAYGAQDIYLTGNPQITFFKVVYRRHTNFSMEHIQQTFKGTPGSGARVVATVSRNGDLIHDCYIKFNCTDIGTATHEVNNPGHALINNVEVEIGGQSIDKQYGHFMEAHAELTEKNYGLTAFTVSTSKYGINAVNSELSPFQQTSGAGGTAVRQVNATASECNLYVPLRFWFCRHVGLSLPLIALQYHEVNINVTFSGDGVYGNDIANNTVNIGDDPELWVNYIYLDTDERRRFAQVSHEYLIEQVQQQDGGEVSPPVSKTFKLNFNHPVKELIWVGLSNVDGWGKNSANANALTRWGNDTTKHKLILNGHDRFAEQDLDYFTRYQPYKYHRNLTRSIRADSIAVYSFALKPEEHQPSGTCNFSRIDSSQLEFTNPSHAANIFIYAINYNVLRIMSGMGGLAYSN